MFAIYLTQVLLLALLGGAIGMVLGAMLPFLISWGFGAIIPLPIEPAVHPADLSLALRLRADDGAGLRALAARPRP